MRLHVHRGIVVSDTLQTTTDARIYAVGECAAHRGIAYGLVAPLFEQGKVLANHLAEFGIGRYQGSLTSTKLKVTGIDLFSAGDFQGGEGTEPVWTTRLGSPGGPAQVAITGAADSNDFRTLAVATQTQQPIAPGR